jgi:hypothetical membrane protein
MSKTFGKVLFIISIILFAYLGFQFVFSPTLPYNNLIIPAYGIVSMVMLALIGIYLWLK